MTTTCAHMDTADPDVAPSDAEGCHECLESGDRWVHLRICAICGHVGCCDASKNHHATRHHEATGHPLIRSYERNDDWWYCYPDDVVFRVEGTGPARS